MTRLWAFVLSLLGLALLLVGCGGGEDENAIIAVAFRLDEGSPLMAAYAGDPAEDPFELPAGRYYVEALDEEEVWVSLGAVDVAEGGAVAVPGSFEDAGGVPDPERAEPLITVASFLLDVELAEYAYLDIATGGFTLPPFDPAMELDAASVRELFDLHRRIGEQKDAVLEALSDIEERAEVSTGRSYVRSSAASAPGDFDAIEEEARGFFDLVLGSPERQRQRALEVILSYEPAVFFSKLPDDLKVVGGRAVYDAAEWEEHLRDGRLDDKLPEIHAFLNDFAAVFAIALLVEDKEPAWLTRGQTPPGSFSALIAENTTLVRQSGWVSDRRAAWERYARNLAADLGEDDPAQVRQRLEERIRSNLAELFPDNPNIADFVVDDCLDRVIQAVPGLRGGTAPGAQTPTATPQASATVAAKATETPQAEPHGVTAIGTFVLAMGPECTVDQNTMSLTFNTGGGPATGEGHWRESCKDHPECPPNVWLVSYDLKGAYDRGSQGFTGTADMSADGVFYTPPSEPGAECYETLAGGGPGYTGMSWRATLQGGSLKGEIMLSEATGDPSHVIQFDLTVQGQ